MISPRYTVIWLPEAEDGLAEYWTAAGPAERDRFAAVVDRIDRSLAAFPDRCGRPDPVEDGLRLWDVLDFPPPARVSFRVSPPDRTVTVLRLTLFRI